jgi:hypothetical protein
LESRRVLSNDDTDNSPADRCKKRERWLDTSPIGPRCFWRLVEATVSSFTLLIRHTAASRFGIATRATINRMFTWMTHRRTVTLTAAIIIILMSIGRTITSTALLTNTQLTSAATGI